MQRTPPSAKETKMYGSESNIHEMKDQMENLADWVNPRKKRILDELDGETSTLQVSSVQKTSCCSENTLSNIKEAMDSFHEEMKIMMQTLTIMKSQQEEGFATFRRDISEIKNTIGKLQKSNEELDQSLDYLGKKCAEFEATNRELTNTVKIQENKINDLAQKNVYLDKCNKALEERVCLLEQRELDCNVELINVQAVEGMSTIQIAKAVAKELKLCPEKIIKAWRVGKIKDGKDSRPLIVSLQTREDRTEWLGCRKNVITNDLVFNNKNSTRIYINENVTQHIRHLFWETKSELKDIYKYIWIQNARILIRKSETDKKIHQIRRVSDIKTFLNNKDQE